MKFCLLFFCLFGMALSLLAEETIQSLQNHYKKMAKINIVVAKEGSFAIEDKFKLTVSYKNSEGEIKTYTQVISSKDTISLPEGIWDFELFYKYGYSPFKATYHIKNKKKYDIEIDLSSWLEMDISKVLVGHIFDKKLLERDFTAAKVEDFELARLDFYGLPIKGSFAPMQKTFLTNWLTQKPYGGRIWFCSRLPFPIIIAPFDFNFQALQSLDSSKVLSFYYRPFDSERQNTLYMRSLPLFRDYFEADEFYYPQTASSLVFDTIAGPLYTGLDIDLSSEADQKIWFTLLNLGYQIPAVSSDYTTARGLQDAWMFLTLPPTSSIEEKFKALQMGASVMSTGPSLFVSIDHVLPGGSLLADNKNHQMTILARTEPSTGDEVEYFEIIRNGEVTKKIKPEVLNNTFQVHFYHVFEQTYAWYVIRIKTRLGGIAISNPIYFLPMGYNPPAPASSLVRLSFVDSNGDPITDVKVIVIDNHQRVKEEITQEKSTWEGQLRLTSRLIIQKEGYFEESFFLAENAKQMELLAELSTNFDKDQPLLADPSVYKKLREDLKIMLMTRILKKK